MAELRPLRDVLLEKGQALFSGRVDVDANGLAGFLHLSDGIVLEAKLGTASGEPALWHMLLAEKPRITLEPGKPRATGGEVLGKPDLLLERYDERLAVLEVYADKVGGFDRIWAIRFDALASVLEDLPDAINPVLRLLDGKRTVRAVVAECPIDDMLALRILGKLLSLGVLVLPDDVVQKSNDASIVEVDEGLEAALAASLAEMDAEDAAADAADPIPLTTRTVPPTTAPPRTTPPTAPPPPAMTPDPVTMMPKNVTMAPDESPTLPVVMGLPSAPPVQTQSELRSWLGSEEEFFTREPRRSGEIVRPPASRGLSPVWMVVILVVGAVLGVVLTKGC